MIYDLYRSMSTSSGDLGHCCHILYSVKHNMQQLRLGLFEVLNVTQKIELEIFV